MSLSANLVLMADYNQWINKQIYTAASTLNTLELNKNRGAFFGSILNTLNHIFVGDVIWLKRFAEHPSHHVTLDSIRKLSQPKALDEIIYTDFEVLLSARIQLDATIQSFTRELTDDVLASPLAYTNTKGDVFTKNFGHLILHLFNHQTHHRGQVSTLLHQAGVDVGITDLLFKIPNEEAV